MFLESSLQILFLIIGLLSLAYISWKRLAFGIYLIIFSLPLYLLRLKVFFIPTTVLELAIYVVFLVWLIRQLIKRICHYEEPHQWRRSNPVENSGIASGLKLLAMTICNSFYTPILLLITGCIISTLASSDIRTSLGIFKGWFIDPLLLFLVVTSYMRTKEQVRNILISFSLSGIVIVMISIFYWLFPSFEGVAYDMRLRGFYLSPNYLAMVLAPILLITYGFFLSSLIKSLRKEKIFWTFSFIIISIPLYLTYSYGAWLGLFAGFIFISVWFLRKYRCWLHSPRQGAMEPIAQEEIHISAPQPCLSDRQARSARTVEPTDSKKIFLNLNYKNLSLFNLLVVVIISCILISAIFSSQLETEKFQKIFDGTRSSLQSRIMIWRAGLEILKDHPILGIGPGNFQEHYLAYQPKFPPYLEWAVPQPHNLFLAFWLQCGLIGLIGFIWIVVLFLKKGFGILKEGEDTYPRLQAKFFACILISQMIYILIHGLVDTPYWKNDLAVMFWVMVGLMIVMSQDEPR